MDQGSTRDTRRCEKVEREARPSWMVAPGAFKEILAMLIDSNVNTCGAFRQSELSSCVLILVLRDEFCGVGGQTHFCLTDRVFCWMPDLRLWGLFQTILYI